MRFECALGALLSLIWLGNLALAHEGQRAGACAALSGVLGFADDVLTSQTGIHALDGRGARDAHCLDGLLAALFGWADTLDYFRL